MCLTSLSLFSFCTPDLLFGKVSVCPIEHLLLILMLSSLWWVGLETYSKSRRGLVFRCCWQYVCCEPYWEFRAQCTTHTPHRSFYAIHSAENFCTMSILTLRLLMSYIYGAPSKARNANVVYIYMDLSLATLKQSLSICCTMFQH